MTQSSEMTQVYTVIPNIAVMRSEKPQNLIALSPNYCLTGGKTITDVNRPRHQHALEITSGP
jgi:hypothetical protein